MRFMLLLYDNPEMRDAFFGPGSEGLAEVIRGRTSAASSPTGQRNHCSNRVSPRSTFPRTLS